MLPTAWCWTNKAASFFSALHEYWRLQLIKWQHRQLHQPAASSHWAGARGEPMLLSDAISAKDQPCVCAVACTKHTGEAVPATGQYPFVSPVTVAPHGGSIPPFVTKGDQASRWQKSTVTPDTQAQANADSQPLRWLAKPSMNGNKQKDKVTTRDSCKWRTIHLGPLNHQHQNRVPRLGAQASRYELTGESLQSNKMCQRTRKPEVGGNSLC